MLTYKIDHITASINDTNKPHANTIGDTDTAQALASDFFRMMLPDKRLDIQRTPALKFYVWQFHEVGSGIVLDIPHDATKQGLRCVLHGAALRTNTAGYLAAMRLKNAGWHVTRIDFAFDFMDEAETMGDVVALTSHRLLSDAASVRIINEHGSRSVYLGSRQSAFFARIYDKAAEQNVPRQWVRWELEAKLRLAEALVDDLAGGYKAAAALLVDRAELEGMSMSDELKRLAGGAMVKDYTPPRVKGKTEAWLYDQVLPAFVKLAATDEEAARDVITTMLLKLEIEAETRDRARNRP